MAFESSATQDNQALETERKREAFATLFQETLRKQEVGVPSVEYKLPYPKEDFLRFIVEENNVLLHGSPNRDIETLEPRQANDRSKVSGNKKVVYAVTDPVFPLFFAIMDRDRLREERFSGVVESSVSDNQETGEPEYEFKIPKNALEIKPWTRGMIYLFDKNEFHEEKDDAGESSGEWTSETPVRPLAKLEVGPEDFRFLDKVEGE